MQFRGTLLLAAFAGFAASVNAGPGTNTTTRPPTWAIKLAQTSIPNLYQVTTNLYRGAQPTAQGMAELQAMGIKTIVNLRHFHSDREELLGTNLKQGWLHMNPWHAEDADVIGFLKLAANTNNLPLFVHCQRGADRTGMVCAMYRIALCGWTKQEAIQEMEAGGFKFNPVWKNLIRYIERANIEDIKKRAGITSKSQRPESESRKKANERWL